MLAVCSVVTSRSWKPAGSCSKACACSMGALQLCAAATRPGHKDGWFYPWMLIKLPCPCMLRVNRPLTVMILEPLKDTCMTFLQPQSWRKVHLHCPFELLSGTALVYVQVSLHPHVSKPPYLDPQPLVVVTAPNRLEHHTLNMLCCWAELVHPDLHRHGSQINSALIKMILASVA